MKTIMPRDYLEKLVVLALQKGYTMVAIDMVIRKLNIEVRG